MNKKQKFESFLESLKGTGQDTLIENVKKGFQVCFENFIDPMDTAEDIFREAFSKIEMPYDDIGIAIGNILKQEDAIELITGIDLAYETN